MPRDLTHPGSYSGKLIGGNCGTLPGGKDTPYIKTQWEVTHRWDGDDWTEIPTAHAEVMWFLTDPAWPYTQPKLEGLGFNGDFERPAFDQVGQALVLRCEHRQDNRGITREQWDIGGDESKEHEPLSKDRLRVFAARYKTDAANSKKPPGSPPAGPEDAKPKTPF